MREQEKRIAVCQDKGLRLTSAVLRLVYKECNVKYCGGHPEPECTVLWGACNFIKQMRLKIKGQKPFSAEFVV